VKEKLLFQQKGVFKPYYKIWELYVV
jgi:hypothetical protein